MRKKGIIVAVVACLIILTGGVLYFFLQPKPTSDALRFKEEYESLNGTIRESDGAKYNDVDVDKVNPIKYIDAKEAIEVLDSNQAVIYIGANWCPWCRNAIPVLFEVAKTYGVDTIYYLDLDNEKSSFEVKDGVLSKTKDGSKAYYELLDKLSERLSDYIITKDDKKYETGEKRIFMPYVIGVKNGHVSVDHVGTVSLNEGQTKYDKLSDEQHEKLKDIYIGLFESVYGKKAGSCDDNVCY